VRHRIVLRATLFSIVLACSACTFALNPSLDIHQYAHTAWKVRDGFTQGVIFAIAQTPDGYLWLGTEFGLYRFDGVHAVAWQPPTGQDLPSRWVHRLLAARDGTLWIGTDKGIASWRSGKLTRYPELDGQIIYSLLEDRDGTIWSSGETFPSPAMICAIRSGRGVQCYGNDGSLGGGRAIVSLYEDRQSSLWAVAKNGIWRWKPGAPKFYPLPNGANSRSDYVYLEGTAEDETGKLLIGMEGGIRRFFDGKTESYKLPSKIQPFPTRTLLRDRDGGLWIAVYHGGLLHVHQGRADVFRQADGLSSDEVLALFEDRENNLWVSTQDGLDRFRDTAVATLSSKEGLSNALARSVLADKDGSVWVATPGGLDRWREGQIAPFDKRDGKLNGSSPTSLFRDSGGRMWVSTTRELGYLEGDRFVSVSKTELGRIQDIAEDSNGDLWMADQQGGLLHFSGSKLVERISWASIGHQHFALSLAPDHLRGGLWIGFYEGGISYFANGHIQKTYAAAEGLVNGSVTSLRVDKDGTLWAATDSGLTRMKNGSFSTLSSRNGLPCDPVRWMIQDDDHSLWLYTSCGLMRLTRSDIDGWTGAADRHQEANQMVHPTVFDSSDGVRVHALAYRAYNPTVTKSSDGRIWFLPLDGVSVIDPPHVPFNTLPPPVHIEQVVVDWKTFDSVSDPHQLLKLPPLTHLEIDYTALSLVASEKVHFRLKLEGLDSDWHDVGDRRQAIYTNLAPRRYRFRVLACNNSGVWNEAGAYLEFAVLPTFYQTAWFRIACAVASLVLLWAIYRFRVQQLQRQFAIGLEARVNERTRIARELHDTLLQSLHGLMFQFQAARNLLPRRPDDAMRSLDDAIGETKKAVAESRDTIQGLRLEPMATGNLADFLMSTSRELAKSAAGPLPPVFDLIEEGEQQMLSPATSNEICRIGVEILRNAYRHAHARRIEAEIRYGDHMLRLRIRDDGQGIDPSVLKEGGRVGHWGLRGIRERAERIGASLDFWSELGEGTEVELAIPGAVAYEKTRDSYRAKLLRKVTSRAQRS
jgi:ligand-binding sensor domain-containing protein/signal transduction histidine kinase